MKNLLVWYRKVALLIFLVLGIMLVISFGGDSLLKKIEVGEVSAWTNTIENILTEEGIAKLSELRFLIAFIMVVAIALYFYKPRITVICHTSFSPVIESISKEFCRDYYVKNKKITLDECMKKQDIGNAIVQQDSTVQELISNNRRELGYLGIAHTPLIFRMGYLIGDQKNLHIFHKKRTNSSMFEEWSEKNDGLGITLKAIEEKNKTCKSDEMYVAIGTTFPIKITEIESIAGKDKHIMVMQTTNQGFDVINNYGQAEVLREQILSLIRDKEKDYNIRKLHLMISSSVGFTFFLGTAFSPQHDPEIIVYHYENGRYTWGINMSKKGAEAVVKE